MNEMSGLPEYNGYRDERTAYLDKLKRNLEQALVKAEQAPFDFAADLGMEAVDLPYKLLRKAFDYGAEAAKRSLGF